MSARDPQLFANVLQGHLAALPPLPDPSIEPRTIYECDDSPSIFYCAFVAATQTWLSIGAAAQAATFYVDPAGGSDANPGTQALPFKSWHSGAWPRLSALGPTLAAVNYVGATADASLVAGTTYQLPPGVVLTVTSPWTDIGLGVRTAGAGSTTASIVDSVGGLAANIAEGSRVRFLTGALAGQSYSVPSNSATAFAADYQGLASAPAAGDTFVLERAAGGWSMPATGTTVFDASGPGCAWNTTGFKLVGSTGIFEFVGPRSWSGMYMEFGASACTVRLRGAAMARLGRTVGAFGGNNDGPKGLRGVGCYFHGTNANTTISPIGDTYWSIDMVVSGCAWTPINATEEIQGLHINGQGGPRGRYAAQYCRSFVFGTVVVGCTSSPLSFLYCDTCDLSSLTVDATTTADAVVLNGTRATLFNCTGAVAGAGTVGVRLSNGGAVDNSSGANTITGASGDIAIDGRVGLAWASQGTYFSSSAALSGAQLSFAGGFTGGAGATTAYFGLGGLPVVANFSATAIRTPMSPGRLAQALRETVLSNGLTTATVLTLLRAPVATGTPAATAITLSVAATTTGTFSDTAHVAQYQDGDQFDLQAVNTAGGANPFTHTASLLAA